MTNELIKQEIATVARKRVGNGTVVEYKDGNKYLTSPGFSPVRASVYSKYLRSVSLNSMAEDLDNMS